VSQPYRIEVLTGPAILPHLAGLARLRVEVFRDFPYLYDGSEDYERKYIATYAAAPDALVVAAYVGDELVGAATALPLADEPEHVKAPVAARGLDVARVFYCGESVLRQPYRGRGIGHAFFEAREAHARRLGRFERIGFCAVLRPADHPARPADYRPLNAFWRRHGYQPVPGLTCTMSWRDIGDIAESAKPMQFWMKAL